MKFETVSYEKSEGIARIVLNRPEVLNAINSKMLMELAEAFKIAGRDEDVRTIVLTGAGKAFSSGMDFSLLEELGKMGLSELYEATRLAQGIYSQIESSEKPVIAAINGPALGGGLELTLVCDLRIASENAIFGLPEVAVGIVPDLAGCQRLPRIVGLGKAKELVMTAKLIDAREAERIGLVNKVVPSGKLEEEVLATAKAIMMNSSLAVILSKKILNLSFDVDMETLLNYTALAQRICIQNEDVPGRVREYVRRLKGR
ncbi:MAG: enoyl-CoA hydratase/isomerase family protein [Candidatus Jordarchaeales archaeon]|nr:enoyl-CoA hydratase/isomerase family protein [Candidatus Jordarchaeia archaeon]